MRQRIYVVDPETGTLRPAWSENVPGGYARAPGTRGELVVGVSQRDLERANQKSKRAAA